MLKWYGPSLALAIPDHWDCVVLIDLLAFFWMRGYTSLHGAGGAVMASLLRQIHISDGPACHSRDRVQVQILPILYKRTPPSLLKSLPPLLHITHSQPSYICTFAHIIFDTSAGADQTPDSYQS